MNTGGGVNGADGIADTVGRPSSAHDITGEAGMSDGMHAREVASLKLAMAQLTQRHSTYKADTEDKLGRALAKVGRHMHAQSLSLTRLDVFCREKLPA